MTSSFSVALDFLIQTAFSLYLYALLLRFLLQITRADFRNPFCQFIVKVTQPAVAFVRRFVPGVGGMDWATLLIFYFVAVIKFLILYLLVYRLPLHPLGLLLLALADIIQLTLQFYFFAIVVFAVASWFTSTRNNPMLNILGQLTAPILRPLQHHIPPVAGFDLSPLIVLILIKLIEILLVTGLVGFAQGLSVGRLVGL